MLLILLLGVYFFIIYLWKPKVFSYKFDDKLISKYFCSQDIITEPKCKRLFLSDEEIHIAAGYLYVKGEDPTEYNFQHPPLIKYLYGLSTLGFGNPYLVQVLFGAVLLLAVYAAGLMIYRSFFIALLAGFFLIFDPLFIELSSQALLDLGQAVFLMFYVLSFLKFEKKYILQGVLLGLLCASKFWGVSVFAVLFVLFYQLINKKFKFKNFIFHLVTGFVVFVLVYINVYLRRGFDFNIIFFQIKTLKYWLNHSVSAMPLGSLLLFLTGYVQEWWGEKQILKQVWSLFWPAGFFSSLLMLIKFLINGQLSKKIFIGIFPAVYLFFLSFQAPFTRCFILILPFAYLNLAFLIEKMLNMRDKNNT
jgi:hypothetical protein